MPSPDRPAEMTNARVLTVAAAVTVTVVLWGSLVFAAIDFGRDARSGSSRDWIFLVLATLGAVACMFAAIVMAARMQSMLRMPQRSSTRPLPLPLDDALPMALPERPGESASQPSYPAPRAARNPDAGKRAARG